MKLSIFWLAATFRLYAQTQSGPAACTTAGAVFAVDSIANVLLVKDSTGYIGDVEVPKSTPVLKLLVKAGEASGNPAPISMSEIQIGDLVCIEKAADSKAASQVTVVARTDVERAQREFVNEWQNNAVFGPVITIDAAGRKMTVNPLVPVGSTLPTIVDLSGDVQYRTFSETAQTVAAATSISLSDIQQGQHVFVRGKRSGGDMVLVASSVTKGGVRGIIATFLEADPPNMTVKVRETGTGKIFAIRIPSGSIYRTTNQLNSPYRIQGPGGLMLERLDLTDLHGGDVVLVVGKVNYDTGQGTGLALITRFGYFGAAPNGDKQQLGWFFK